MLNIPFVPGIITVKTLDGSPLRGGMATETLSPPDVHRYVECRNTFIHDHIQVSLKSNCPGLIMDIHAQSFYLSQHLHKPHKSVEILESYTPWGPKSTHCLSSGIRLLPPLGIYLLTVCMWILTLCTLCVPTTGSKNLCTWILECYPNTVRSIFTTK